MQRRPGPPARFPARLPGSDPPVPRPAAAAPAGAAGSAPSALTGLMRARMVQRLAGGMASAPVLQAMGAVERHRFVDSALGNQAYEDISLPIGLGQTISKPQVV